MKKLSGKGLGSFLVFFVASVIVSGFLIAKAAESIKYREDAERAVQLSKETPEVQGYLAMHPDAQYRVKQDEHYWYVHWYRTSLGLLDVVNVIIDKISWKIVEVDVLW